MLNILIMAGGKGERFWPKSRINLPKQLLNLTGNGTMIQETFLRVKDLTDPAHIFIVTVPDYVQVIREQLPEIPPENVLIEPEGRNTAPCIGLAATIIGARDPEGVLVVLASDHLIEKNREFRDLLVRGAEIARQTEGVVTLGIRPNRPETGYGYIKVGEGLSQYPLAFRVERFIEKPALEMARDFVESGRYLWNSGMFIWKISAIRELFALLLPEMYQGLLRIEEAFNSEQYQTVLTSEYHKFEKISIDYGIMQKAPQVYVLTADIGWDDVGSWTALERIRERDEHGNVLTGEVVALDLESCIFETSRQKIVAAIGLRDLVYVETDDAVLICPKSRLQDIKPVLERIRERGKLEFL